MEHPTPPLEEIKKNYSLFLAFTSFGLFIGFLMGLTTGEIVTQFITAVFSIAGTICIAFFTKMNQLQIRMVSNVILAMTLGLILGLLIGIFTKEYEVFVPKYRKTETILKHEKIEKDSLIKLLAEKTSVIVSPKDTAKGSELKKSSNINLQRQFDIIQQQLKDVNAQIQNNQHFSQSVLKKYSLDKIALINKNKIKGIYSTEDAYDSLYKYVTHDKK